MSTRATKQDIKEFKKDRGKLAYTDAEIAKRMGMDRSNYSSYVNERLPITRRFLRKFYLVFGPELFPSPGIAAHPELVACIEDLNRCLSLFEEHSKKELQFYSSFIIQSIEFAEACGMKKGYTDQILKKVRSFERACKKISLLTRMAMGRVLEKSKFSKTASG